jgi:tight adherence protein C
MGLALFTFLAVFILLGSVGLLLFYRAAMMQRLSAVLDTAPDHGLLRRLRPNNASDSIKAIVQPFEKVLPKSPQEVTVIQQRLIRAGYRDDSAVQVFYGAKVLVPILLCVVGTLTGISRSHEFLFYALALGLGFLAPDFWLGRQISKRQMKIRLGLPELLDLMVICIEAGLSLDLAMSRSVAELQLSQPEISDELSLLILEQRAGRPRSDAWKNLADRIDVDVIRGLVSSINQADQFGTSVAKSLRVHSETLRTQRRQRVEELAAKMSVKLVFPLVLFIFPSLFIVALGPALIVMQDTMNKYFN